MDFAGGMRKAVTTMTHSGTEKKSLVLSFLEVKRPREAATIKVGRGRTKLSETRRRVLKRDSGSKVLACGNMNG